MEKWVGHNWCTLYLSPTRILIFSSLIWLLIGCSLNAFQWFWCNSERVVMQLGYPFCIRKFRHDHCSSCFVSRGTLKDSSRDLRLLLILLCYFVISSVYILFSLLIISEAYLCWSIKWHKYPFYRCFSIIHTVWGMLSSSDNWVEVTRACWESGCNWGSSKNFLVAVFYV